MLSVGDGVRFCGAGDFADGGREGRTEGAVHVICCDGVGLRLVSVGDIR